MEEAPGIVPTLEHVKVRAEALTIQKNGVRLPAFRIRMPFGYRYPKIDAPKNFEERMNKETTMPEAGIVARDIVRDTKTALREVEAAHLPFDERGTFRLNFRQINGLWTTNENVSLPAPIANAFASALAHEAAINPNVKRLVAEVSIRMQGPHTIDTEKVEEPHTDYSDSVPMSLYFISSAPTTEQYTGLLTPEMRDPNEDDVYEGESSAITQRAGGAWWRQEHVARNANWSSLLPWTLYRGTSEWVHSLPETLSARIPTNEPPRFFMRIAFREHSDDF